MTAPCARNCCCKSANHAVFDPAASACAAPLCLSDEIPKTRTYCRHSCARICFTAIKCRLTTEYAAATLVSANDTGVAKNFFVGHRCPVRILSHSCSRQPETRINARKTSVGGPRHSSMGTDKIANAIPQSVRKAIRFCPMRHGGQPEKQYRTSLVWASRCIAPYLKNYAESWHPYSPKKTYPVARHPDGWTEGG